MTTLLPLVVAFSTLATARVTRLVTTDLVTQPIRAWLLNRINHDKPQRATLRAHHRAVNDALTAGTPPPTDLPALPPLQHPGTAKTRAWFAYLVECRWCASVWVAYGITIPTLAWAGQPAHWFSYALTPLAVSYATGWLSEFERG